MIQLLDLPQLRKLRLNGRREEAFEGLRAYPCFDAQGNPKLPASVQIAEEWLHWGELDAAGELFREILRTMPHHPWASLGLARVVRLQGGEIDAARPLLSALSDTHLGADQPFVRLFAAEWEAWGEFGSAERIYTQAAQSGHGWAQRALLALRVRQGDSAGALCAAEQLLSAAPDDRSLQLNVAELLEQLGRVVEAQQMLQRILALDPGHKEAINCLFLLLKQQGDKRKLLDFLEGAHDKVPANLHLRAQYLFLRRERGSLIQAQRGFAELAREFPMQPTPTLQAGSIAAALGLRPMACEWLRRAVELDTKAQPALFLTTELIRMGRVDEAWQVLTKIEGAEGEPSYWPARLQMTLLRNGFEAMAHEYALLLAGESENERLIVWLRLGRDFAMHRQIEAELAHRMHTPLPPESFAAMVLQRAQNLLALGECRQAAQLLGQVETTAKETPFGLAVAELWLDLAYPRRAQRLLRQIVAAVDPAEWTERDLDAALRIAHGVGDCDTSQTLEAAISDTLTFSAGILVNGQAMRLHSSGRHSELEAFLNRQSEENPDFPRYRWQTRLALQGNDPRTALRWITPLMGAPVADLEDVRLYLRALIDSEQYELAEQELTRLAPNYAEVDLAQLHAKILIGNLQFEAAHDILARAMLLAPASFEHALAMVDLLLRREQLGDAEAIVDLWLARMPAHLAWVQLRLALDLRLHRDWKAWEERFAALAPRVKFHERLSLVIEQSHALMCMRRHEEATLLCRHFERGLARWPLPVQVRMGARLSLASRYTFLAMYDQADRVLADLEAADLPASMRIAFHRLSINRQVFSGGEARVVAEHSRQLGQVRHRLKICEFKEDDGGGEMPPVRLAVLLHLFYQQVWPQMRPFLENLRDANFRLFVTVGEQGIDESILADLRAIDPQVVVRIAENRGFDLGAHWQSLAHIDLTQFDVVALLQEKRSSQNRVGDVWRDNMLQALLGSRAAVRDNLAAFLDPKVGLIGSAMHRQSIDDWQYGKMRELLLALGLPTRFDALSPLFEFVGGSIMMIRAGILSEIHRKTWQRIPFEHYSELSAAGRLDRSYAHALERMLGIYVRWKKRRILWRPAPDRER